MANEKKYYTFTDITDGPDNVKNITADLTLTRPEVRELQDGKKVLTCSAAFSNQTKALSKALGVELQDNNGTVWVDVQFWEDHADRFQKFLNDREKVRVIVCGRLNKRTWTTKSGEQANRVQISVRNWNAVYTPSVPATSAASNDAVVDDGQDEPLF